MHQPKSLIRLMFGLAALGLILGVGIPRMVARATLRQADRASLEGGVAWINTAPIHLEELRGKIVLLDFWTYCCINCHHILPVLEKIEEKYPNEVVVIGVHTPKFFAERDTENLRKKVHEYKIKHPVVNDANQALWNRFGVNSWPTLLVLGPTGEVLGNNSGEIPFEILDKYVGKLVREYRAKKELSETPVKFFPESEKPDNSPLSFPGKVVADKPGDRLFVADTGHNRIVLTDLKGKKPVVIGTGAAALTDGAYDKAAFNRPQGMCQVGDVLYVADTENHALRAVDLAAKTVTTLAGDGKQSHNLDAHGMGKATSLTSPWDVAPIPGTKALAIAMAGQHQIWRYDIPSGVIQVWAGTGRENIEDGALKFALFSQPSGLASDGEGAIYVADSEVSAIRALVLGKKPYVKTIVGQGLFVFDDVDGRGDAVRLQHCLGVAWGGGKLYIADTYNNKIKVCDPESRTVETLVGSKKPGTSDDPAQFDEPAGLSVAGNSLYVADTNNGLIRVVDLKEKTVKTLELAGLKPPAPPKRTPHFPRAQEIAAKPVQVEPGKSFEVVLKVPVEAGFKLNEEAPMPYLVETPDASDALASGHPASGAEKAASKSTYSVAVKLDKPAKAGDALKLKVSLSAFVCGETSSLCKVKNYVWTIPVQFSKDGKERVVIE